MNLYGVFSVSLKLRISFQCLHLHQDPIAFAVSASLHWAERGRRPNGLRPPSIVPFITLHRPLCLLYRPLHHGPYKGTVMNPKPFLP